MASFRDELDRLTESMQRLNGATEKAAKGTAKREQEEEQRSFFKSSFGLVGAAMGPALNQSTAYFGTTGDLEGAGELASSGIVEALAAAFPLLSNLGGTSKELRVRQSAREKVIDQFDDLARYNVPYSDEFLQRQIDTAIQQQERVEGLRARVARGTAYTVSDAGNDIAGTAVDRLIVVLEKLQEAVSRLPIVGGQ